jgi:hypothetical protein
MENNMIEGVDYCFMYPKDDANSVHVRLLSGKYEDTVFKYGRVKFEEKNNEMYLLFNYDVLESTFDKPKAMEKNEDFKNYIGNLLTEIMSSNIEQELVDEVGTSNSQEFNLQ